MAAGVVLHVTAKEAHACSAPAPAPDLQRAFKNADSVFRGEVVSRDSLMIGVSDERKREVERIMWQSGAKGDEVEIIAAEDIVEFKVTEVWKGDLYETMYVRSTWEQINAPLPMPCPPSRVQYLIGHTYLVFVYGGEANVGWATVTRPITYYSDSGHRFLENLGAGETPAPGTVGPIPERIETPVEKQTSNAESPDERSGSGCGLTNGYTSGGVNLSAIGLTILLAWFWLRQRFRR
ncbi:MAG: hypothetical protein F4Y44_02775 [Chloroflexi bacterium]|nr:hypothetical protein [Chloroflexota bacterium]